MSKYRRLEKLLKLAKKDSSRRNYAMAINKTAHYTEWTNGYMLMRLSITNETLGVYNYANEPSLVKYPNTDGVVETFTNKTDTYDNMLKIAQVIKKAKTKATVTISKEGRINSDDKYTYNLEFLTLLFDVLGAPIPGEAYETADGDGVKIVCEHGYGVVISLRKEG